MNYCLFSLFWVYRCLLYVPPWPRVVSWSLLKHACNSLRGDDVFWLLRKFDQEIPILALVLQLFQYKGMCPAH